MIYEGKIKYLLSQALGVPDAAELMGYTEQAYNWCKDNEGTIWKAIIERKHLYTPDQLTTSQYFEDTPTIFPGNDAPGNIGTWIGWQIINQYIKETGSYPGGVDAKQRRPRNPNRLKVQTPINRKTALFSRTRRIT